MRYQAKNTICAGGETVAVVLYTSDSNGIASKYLDGRDRLRREIGVSFSKWKLAQGSSSSRQENAKAREEPDTDPERKSLLLSEWLECTAARF